MKYGKWIIITLLATITLFVPVAYLAHAQKPTQTVVQPTLSTTPLNADTLFVLVNEERTKAGVAPLVRDARLDVSAKIKADDMLIGKYFAHVNPTTGQRGYELIPSGVCTYQGENLALISTPGDKNYTTIEWWNNSATHRDTMLDQRYTLTGMAVSGSLVVQHFCQQ